MRRRVCSGCAACAGFTPASPTPTLVQNVRTACPALTVRSTATAPATHSSPRHGRRGQGCGERPRDGRRPDKDRDFLKRRDPESFRLVALDRIVPDTFFLDLDLRILGRRRRAGLGRGLGAVWLIQARWSRRTASGEIPDTCGVDERKGALREGRRLVSGRFMHPTVGCPRRSCARAPRVRRRSRTAQRLAGVRTAPRRAGRVG